MFAIFKQKLFRNWLMILGWGIGLAFLGFLLFDVYDSFFIEDIAFEQLLQVFPEEILAFFGGDVNIFEPAGFLHLEFFSYMPVILGFVAISSAVGLFAKKEEDGTLELILAQPISRSAVFWGRSLALIISLALILIIALAGFVIGYEYTETFEVETIKLVFPFLSLFAVLFVFLAFTLFVSMVLPSSASIFVGGFLLIASWFISSLARIYVALEGVNRFSPMNYYQGGGAMTDLNMNHLLILLGAGLVFILLSWVLFLKRDLRFGSSGGLHLAFKREKEKA
jgi:ABC-2 type transport system permease protein